MVAARDGARTERRNFAAARQRTRTRNRGAEDHRRADEGAGERRHDPRPSRPLVCARNHRLSAPHIAPARRLGAQSCFAGSLFELALAADRSYMRADGAEIALSGLNLGGLEMLNGRTRLAARFNLDRADLGEGRRDAGTALAQGLVTVTPDELDWEDEIRLALEERASLSPDALTGLEANLRFAGPETAATKIFARLSAWQNWVFSRPNAIGETGALKRYGTGAQPRFDWQRTG